MIIAGIGSRKTPEKTLEDIRAIGELCRSLKVFVRSGHAEGADMAFEEGAKEYTLVYMPWHDFGPKKKAAPARNYIYFDDTPAISKKLAMESVDKFHPAPHHLKWGGRVCLARDFFQVMGTSGKAPVSCIVCWAEPKGKGYDEVKGGTGQAVRIARANGLPVFNLHEVPATEVMDWISLVAKQEGHHG